MHRTLDDHDARRLAGRAPLPLDPSSPIAIKRDVHDFEVTADAAAFSRAFTEVVTDARSTFGLIRIRRHASRLGRAFEVGERFQGCFSLERAAVAALERRGWNREARAAQRLLARPAVTRLLTWIEDAMLSDYAEIVALEEHRVHYRYLDGTPIAGSSVFLVEPLGPGRCRVRQIFEYQEVGGVALGSFQRFGLKYHDQVVHMQIHQAAARAGAEVVRSTIPTAYAELPS